MQQAQDSQGERAGPTSEAIVIGVDLSSRADLSELVVVTGGDAFFGDAARALLHRVGSVIAGHAEAPTTATPGAGRKFGGPTP